MLGLFISRRRGSVVLIVIPSFFDKTSLKHHSERVHEKKRPFVCSTCEKTFFSKGDLDRHVSAVHLNIRPYICRFCHWAFESSNNMKTHIDRKHVNPLPVRMSRGEKTVGETLDLYVDYVREKSFSDLIGFGGGYLRYDFAIEIGVREERYLLIEFDGKQHFYPITFKGDSNERSALERFDMRRRHDRVKEKYAELYGYPLLRIRYDQIKRVEEIVRDFLKDNIL